MLVLTTPTGNIGHHVLQDVLNDPTAGTRGVRVIVRDPSKIPAHLRERVEVIQGSHSDPQVLDKALAGADALFWVVPPEYQMPDYKTFYTDFTRAAAEAIKQQGVKRVVVVSALGRDWPEDAGLVTGSVAMDLQLEATGVALRVLTMPGFMDNALRQVQPIKTKGMFFGPLDPDKKLPYCATRDIGAGAARLLLDDSWAGQQDVAVLGPEDLSQNDMAQILSEVLGSPVRYQQIPFEALHSQLTSNGASESMAAGMIAMMRANSAVAPPQ